MTQNEAEGVSRLLNPGDTVPLKSLDPTATRLVIAAGWDIIGFEDNGVDVDLSAFMLNTAGQTRIDSDFVFYNNESSAEGAVMFGGDNRTGAGDGDDETLLIDLNKMPMDISSVSIVLSVYAGDLRDHSFRKIRNSFVRLVSADRQAELARLNLDPLITDNGAATALIPLILERDISGWAIRAACDFNHGGLGKIAGDVGIEII
ncbi:MAG: TerD family protein [Pseudomonadota bacterium]